MAARLERKRSKKDDRAGTRATKHRDIVIQQQTKAAYATTRVHSSINDKRQAFDRLTNHMHTLHEKQRDNLIQAQERNYQTEKLLVDLETRHMQSEIRNSYMKKFTVRQNHQSYVSLM